MPYYEYEFVCEDGSRHRVEKYFPKMEGAPESIQITIGDEQVEAKRVISLIAKQSLNWGIGTSADSDLPPENHPPID